MERVIGSGAARVASILWLATVLLVLVLSPRPATACTKHVVRHEWFRWCEGDPTPNTAHTWCYNGPKKKRPSCVDYLAQTIDTYDCKDNLIDTSTHDVQNGCIWRGEPNRYYADGEVVSQTCYDEHGEFQCELEQDEAGEPDRCNDGLDQDDNGEPDDGCLQGENRCSERDADDYPARFSSGHVELQPISAFNAPAPRGVYFGLTYQYGSYTGRAPALVDPGDQAPEIHSFAEDTHFLGRGWTDNFSDRLIIPQASSENFRWTGIRGTIVFENGSGPNYESAGGTYTLTDRGASSSPRWVIQSHTVDGPLHVWAFNDVVLDVVGRTSGTTFSQHVGFLAAYGSPANTTTLLGGYMVTIARHADQRILGVADSLNRNFLFEYVTTQWGGKALGHHLAWVTYRNTPTAVPQLVVSFNYVATQIGSPFAEHLDRIDLPAQGSYRRFLYVPTSECFQCQGLITSLIVPRTPFGSTPGAGVDILPHEIVVEGHEYVTNIDGPPFVKRTFGVNRDWGYVFDFEGNTTVQLDLHQQTASCVLGCPAGSACWDDGLCYRTTTTTYDDVRVIVSSSGASHPEGGGVDYTDASFGANMHEPRSAVDVAGLITTFATSDDGSLTCLVTNDNDNEAIVDLADPYSGCDVPASGDFVVTETRRNATTTTTVSNSLLVAGETTARTHTRNSAGQVTSSQRKGWTQAVDGSLLEVTRTRNIGYDALGRVVRIDGPLDNGVALDVTEYEYYPNNGDDRGRLRFVHKYVGSSSEHYVLTTEFKDFDGFGTPHTIIAPDGATTTLSLDGPLYWTLETTGGSAVPSRLEISHNPDMSVRTVVDGDDACTTYQYGTTAAPSSVPTIIKRSSALSEECGQIPIETLSGEVEIRSFVHGEADRLESVERYFDGVLYFQLDGFEYSPDRRLLSVAALHSSNDSNLEYTAGLLTQVTSPDWPTSDSWRTTMSLDPLNRPSAYAFGLSSGESIVHSLEYSSATSALPTRVTRGLNGAEASASHYVYDDFGQNVEVRSPDHGIVRTEWDVGGRPVLRRSGVGTTEETTSQSTFDSLGRRTLVDHDIEHPVNCMIAADGTPIGDERRVYDTCLEDHVPANFSCVNTTGRLATSYALQACQGGEVRQAARFYSYDGIGRLESVGISTGFDVAAGDASILTYSYTSGSRVESVSDPFAPQATAYGYSETGRLQTMRSGGSLIENVEHFPFGPMANYSTPVDAGGTPLRLNLDYDGRYNLRQISFASNTATYMDRTLSRNGNNLITQINDLVQPDESRYYEYDNFERLTCEARGDATTQVPTSADCTVSSPRAVSIIEYTLGDREDAPPDNRSTVYANIPGVYVALDTETYSYSSGSGRALRLQRTSDTVIMEYDDLGRRVSDYADSDPASTLRRYSYLPSGLVGSVTGRLLDGSPYGITLSYDADRRIVEVLRSVNYEPVERRQYYWDDADRLLAMQIADLRDETDAVVKWTYHFIDRQPVAATRQDQSGLDRYWFVYDERGLIARVVNSNGITLMSSKYDAFGSRVDAGLCPSSGCEHMPFMLPSQIALDAGEASATGPLAINGVRLYSALYGGFLQPAEADLVYQTSPEQYSYGGSNPIRFIDRLGMDYGPNESPFGDQLEAWEQRGGSVEFKIECSQEDQRKQIQTALSDAYTQLQNCDSKDAICNRSFAANVFTQLGLLTGRWRCPDSLVMGLGDLLVMTSVSPDKELAEVVVKGRNVITKELRYGVNPGWAITSSPLNETILSFGALFGGDAFAGDAGCLTKVVAHEAFHKAAFYTLESDAPDYSFTRIGDETLSENFYYDDITYRAPVGSTEEDWVNDQVEECVKCGQ